MARTVQSQLAVVVCLASFIGLSGMAAGDVLVLNSGGRVQGTLLDAKHSPRDKYVIETASGGKLTFDKSQVKEIIGKSDSEEEYERVRREYPDTVDGQMSLALWCRDHNLPRQREQHLARVIELDANHAEAHRLLGHVRLDGSWKTQRQFFEDRGYVKYMGQWMTPQERDLKEESRKVELAEKEWKRKLKLWRGWLEGARAQEALDQFHRIGDPYATRALTELLANDKVEKYRRLYVETLARIDTPAGWRALCERSLNDSSEEVRLTCLDYLTERPSPAMTDYFVGKLRDKENAVVNRAALALGRLKDRRAMSPLIEALVTTHIHVIAPAQQGTSAGFGGFNGASNGFAGNFGNSGPKLAKVDYENQDVRQALINLSGGQDFSFKRDAWKAWYSGQRKTIGVNARRDAR